jgi:hypothetical protein
MWLFARAIYEAQVLARLTGQKSRWSVWGVYAVGCAVAQSLNSYNGRRCADALIDVVVCAWIYGYCFRSAHVGEAYRSKKSLVCLGC